MRRTSGEFKIIEIIECIFQQQEQRITYKRSTDSVSESEALEANAYLVNGQGNTIEAFRYIGKKER